MATFRVGQRVRIRFANGGNADAAGHEATIVRLGDWFWDCYVEVHNFRRSREADGLFAAKFYQLSPLTDPKADAFLESIRQLANKPVREVA